MSDEAEMNEIEAAALEAKRVREAGDATEAALQADAKSKRSWPLVSIGIGLGVGSAALAAVLLYTRRNKG
ncbi:MAG: hypothetical protein WC816_13515 [Sphingomonas sp.]